jgi:alkylation response protein AidB-like acyl-CoA dehydrogenase
VNPEASTNLDAFRAELRAWLSEHCTERYRDLGFRGEPNSTWLERMHEWNRLMADSGWTCIDWPEEFGGRGLGLAHQIVLAEEVDAAGAPGTLNPIGLANIAPSIMAYGTDAQKERLLRPMLRGDEIWCQGFSEPDAGSDLASLSMRAERDGDGWILNGQKVWNTFGQLAHWCELLARTDPTASKHKGISCFVVDMELPGIEVRPLRTATGDAEFCEIFFDDVRIPSDALLGPEHQGWTVAMATLTFERSGVANLHISTRRLIRELIEEVGKAGRAGDPVVRQELAGLWSAGEIQRLLSDRATTRALQGLPAGPESSLIKLVWSQVGQQLPIVATRILGLAALEGTWGERLMHTRSLTIAGGTTEVNRNIIAERVLGLPREPR